MREQSELYSIELSMDLARLALLASLAPGDLGGCGVAHIPHSCRHLGVLIGSPSTVACIPHCPGRILPETGQRTEVKGFMAAGLEYLLMQTNVRLREIKLMVAH
jgi:hypothetical protein